MWVISAALAFDADALLARVHEVAELRAGRLAAQTPSISDDDYRKAATSVVTGVQKIEGHAAKLGWGVGVVDVGIDAFWAALNDETRHGELSALAHVELVAGAACADRRKVLMVLPLPMIADRYWVNENRYNPALQASSGGRMRELVWTSVADPASEPLSAAGKAAIDGLVPVAFNRGAWLLIAVDDGHTLAEFTSWVDPGGSIPASGASMFATAGIVDTFANMASYARRSPQPCAGVR